MSKFKERLEKKGPPGLERRFDAIIEMYKTGQIKSLHEIIENYNKRSAWDFFTYIKMQADLDGSEMDYKLGFKIAVDYINEGTE
jgi:hypothetical protein